MKRTLLTATALGALLAAPLAANASILWIDDSAGNVGTVDTVTGTVANVHSSGVPLTDIGFATDGTLFGTSFGNLYVVNTVIGGAGTIGSYGVGINMNALVGSGSPGILLGAANNTNTVYRVNQTTAGLSAFTTSPLPSAGDLAFAGATLYESGTQANGFDALVNVTTNTVVGQFHTTTTSGFAGVFGLADDGTTMFAVNGTEIYSVNLSNALLTPILDYSGHGLLAANGTAFINEGSNAVPEPASLGLFGTALIAIGLLRQRRNK